MRPLSVVDTSTTLLSTRSSLPIFISPAALARLGHPLGEANLVRGAHKTGIIQIVSSNSSLSYDAVMDSRPDPNQVLWFQLYKHQDRAKAEERVREVVRLGYKVICLTVDALVPGNRERDIRAPWDLDAMEKADAEGGDVVRALGDNEEIEDEVANSGGTAGALISNVDQEMTWEEVSLFAFHHLLQTLNGLSVFKTIPWLRSVTDLPIVIKGIQTVAVGPSALWLCSLLNLMLGLRACCRGGRRRNSDI